MDLFSIDGIAIKNPSSFDIEFYTLTKATRVASGDMVMEYVANKRKFVFGYEAIEARELDVIVDILWQQLATTKQCFHALIYTYNGIQKTATIYSGAIPAQLHNAQHSSWVWKGVSFNLIEK